MKRIVFPRFFFILVLICQTRAYLLVDDECSSDRLSCPDNSSCRPLSCRGYRCACNEGFMPSENNTKCIQGAALGDKCGSISPPCLNANAVCTKGLISLSPPNCQCQKGFVNADNRECLIETVDKRFGESCEKKCGPTLSCTLAFCQCRPGYRQRTTLEIQADPSYQYDCIQNEFSLTKCKGVEVDFYAIDPKSVFQGESKTTLDLNTTESSSILNTSTDATAYQNDNQTFLNPENQSVIITKPTSSETFPSRTMSPKVVSLIIQPAPTMGPKVGLGLTTELRDQNTTFEHNETTTTARSQGSTQDGNFESLPTAVPISRNTTVSTPQESFSVSPQTSNPNSSDSLKTLKSLHPTESQSVSTHSLFQHSTQQLHLTNSTAVPTLAQSSNQTSNPQYPDVRLQTTIPTPWHLSSANPLRTSTVSDNPEKHGLTTTTVLATEVPTISDVVTGSRDKNNNNSSDISNINNNNNNNNNSRSSSTEKGKKAIAMTEAPATKSVGSSHSNSENRISTNAIVIPSVLVIVLAIVIVSIIAVVACKKRRSQLSLSTPIQINPYKLPRPSMMSQALTSAPCPPSSASYPTYHYVNHAFENDRL